MLKKLSCVIACILAMALTFASCKNKGTTPQSKESSVEPENKIVAIAVEGAKTEFEWGDAFIFDGDVVGTYEGGTSVLSEDDYTVNFENYNCQVAGTYDIVISLIEDSSVAVSYEVTVGEKGEYDVRIDSFKQTYSVFEDFSLSNVLGYYVLPDGTEELITEENSIVDLGSYKEFTLGTFNINIKNAQNEQLKKTITIKVAKPKKIRILFIGNSFSDDTAEYLPDILKNLGYENVEIGNMFIGACAIETHYYNALYNYNQYEFRYHNGTSWNKYVGDKKQSIEYGAKYSDWDIISLQQASGSSGLPETYERLNSLAEEVKKSTTNPNVKIVFNMTWAYEQGSNHKEYYNYDRDQQTMYNAIVSTVQEKVAFPVMPCGTAIQNARTSFVGDKLTADGYHLNVYGRYIASLTAIATLLNDDLSSLTWKPSGITEEQKIVAIESALNAVNTPFAITESQYKTA